MRSGAPEPWVLMRGCDFGLGHSSLSLSFLMCRMGAVIIIPTPSVDVQNGKSRVQP